MKFSPLKKRLLQVLADGAFHSGTELSVILQISRAAVWKHINTLLVMGIEITAVSGKGYRITRGIELLDYTLINKALTEHTRNLMSELILHDQIDSTNDYLSRCAQDGAASGLVCLAEYQTAGKGRRGRCWVSPFGSNIYLSILWCLQCGPAFIAAFSLAAGVAVIRALKNCDIREIGLKWPNDLYWRNRKLGGILVEVSGETEGPCTAIVGLGLNLYLSVQDGEIINREWVDLQQIMAADMPSRNRLAAAIINELFPIMAYYERDGISKYINEWRSYDCMLGKYVTLQVGSQQFQGTVQGIDDNGLLKLLHSDGREQLYGSGEVSFSGLEN